MGIISDAGCPAIADPGSEIVRMAHQHGIRVIPLVGPSSILLSLMASGMNGQSFAFNGYLPIDKDERKASLKRLEKRAKEERQSQLFARNATGTLPTPLPMCCHQCNPSRRSYPHLYYRRVEIPIQGAPLRETTHYFYPIIR